MSEVLIGLIKDFTYSNPEARDVMGDHPKVGRVYRIIKSDKEDQPDTYQIYLGPTTNKLGLSTLFIGPALKGSYVGRVSEWTFDIEIINKENLLDYDFNPEDLENIRKWIDSGHKDISHIVSGTPRVIPIGGEAKDMPKDVKQRLETSLAKLSRVETSMKDSAEALTILVNKDHDFFVALSDVLVNFADRYFSTSTDNLKRPSQSFLLSASKDAACFQAIRAIEEYSLEHDDILGIYEAIFFLLLEVQRYNRQDTPPISPTTQDE